MAVVSDGWEISLHGRIVANIATCVKDYFRLLYLPMDDLLTKTRQMLSTRPRKLSLNSIANDTGLTYHWLRAFESERAEDPGVRKVQTLHDYLAAQ